MRSIIMMLGSQKLWLHCSNFEWRCHMWLPNFIKLHCKSYAILYIISFSMPVIDGSFWDGYYLVGICQVSNDSTTVNMHCMFLYCSFRVIGLKHADFGGLYFRGNVWGTRRTFLPYLLTLVSHRDQRSL